jgi:DNA-binding MarR family transcriptional regulator
MNPTHLRYLRAIANEPGPVSAQKLWIRWRVNTMSLSRMTTEGLIEKEIIDGRSHYRLTAAGIAAIETTSDGT